MKVLVIGSINIDEVNYIKNFPIKGETIISDGCYTFHGGKGANQAVAIKRLSDDQNLKVSLFAKVGDDYQGTKEIEHLKNNNIDVSYIYKSNKKTGKANILISYLDKDNKIIVNKGANNDFSSKDLKSLENAIKESDLILMQLEINEYLIQNALLMCKKYKKITILNPAPASNFRSEWLPLIDWIIPNETEFEFIANRKINNINEIEETLDILRKKGLTNAIVTLGDAGVYLSTHNIKQWLEARKVDVIDTTAAGDAFIGGFIAFSLLKNKKDIKFGINMAIDSAALTVQKKGAQESIPTFKEVHKWRKQN